jgi:hypothetical protein
MHPVAVPCGRNNVDGAHSGSHPQQQQNTSRAKAIQH